MKTDYNTQQSEEKMSRINSAGLINSTLENLWKDSYNAMAKGDYVLWNTKLDSIWAILGGDVSENDAEEKTFDSISVSIYKYGSLKSKVGSGFNEKSNPNNPIQYQLLIKKSLFLRRLQNKQGKGTAYESEDQDDWN